MSTKLEPTLQRSSRQESTVKDKATRELAKTPRAARNPARGRLPAADASLPHSDLLTGRSLLDYIEIPFVHWRLIAACLLLSSLLGALALVVWPRGYESEAKLMINVGRESVALDPTATTSQTLMLQKTQEEDINSALEVLASRQVAELVVDTLGAQPILDGVLPSSTGETDSSQIALLKEQAKAILGRASEFADRGLLAIGIKDAVSDRERAVRKVIQSVQIYAPKRSTAVTIHAESKTPQMAQAIAAAVTDGFLDRHFSVNRTEGSFEFFSNQSSAAEKQLNSLMEIRSQYMHESKVVSAEDKRRILTDQLGAVEQSVFATRGELQQTEAETTDLISKVALIPEEIVAATAEQEDLTWSGMRQKVYELEIQEKQMAAMFADDNIKLQQTREQLSGARKILADLSKENVTRQMTPNPVKIRVLEDLQKLQTRTVGLQSMLREKDKQHQEINDEIDKLLSFELKLTEINRNIALLESSLASLKLKLEEARVIEELQRDRISNISIYQPATLVERPASPSKPLLAAAFPLLGIMLGFGLALARETGSKALRTPAHIASKLGRPVLSSIPHTRKLKRLKKFVSSSSRTMLDSECNAILSEILLATSGDQRVRGKTIGVIGVDRSCGASSIASALAIAASENCQMQTVLIDADIKDATVSRAFGLKDAPGLAELLTGSAELHECIQPASSVDLDLVSVAAVGSQGPLEFEGNNFANLLAEFQLDNDLVVIDLPPASRPDRTNSVIQHLDYLVVVVESEKTDEVQAKRLLDRFTREVNAVGIVLNKTRNYVPRLLSSLLS